MELDEAQRAAVELAGSVKVSLVDFATTPPFARHLRRIARELLDAHPDCPDPDVAVVEKLLFEFRYDDGTTVVDRFVGRPGLSEAEREMACGFLDGVQSFFEVLADTPPGAVVFRVRCCLSDLEHVVAPTEPAGVPTLPRGSFLAGRMNPVAGTDLWTTSGALEVLPASRRRAVADAVMNMALEAPWLTHRNPEKLQTAAAQVTSMHERFVARHGSDLVLVAGKEVADLYADAIAPTGGRDAEAVASGRAMARRTIEESELADADHVLVHSHPVAGFGFYQEFVGVAHALESGADPDPDDLDLLRGYLDDEGVPSWLLRRIVADRLPASELALSRALAKPDFRWERDGEHLLATLPGDHEPTVTLAIVPSLCSE
ncbi:MAG TPA: hypothetical protein VFQ01_10680 [Nocardioides sp.]|jgi:hypothetical protein|nr:hypothetical protein [Nocardioides sp.]